MDKFKATDTLDQIFLQAITDEEYFKGLEKIEVSFADWPSSFLEAKIFQETAKAKTHRVAAVQCKTEVPDEFFAKETLTLEDTKSLYREALDFLLGQELAKQIMLSPSNFRSLIDRYNKSATAIAGMFRLPEIVEAYAVEQERKIQSGSEIVVIKNFEILSEVIDGFQPGRVSIFTAPTGFGKTNLGLNLFIGATESNLKTLYVNMEMSPEDMGKRIVQAKSGATKAMLSGKNYLQVFSDSDIAGWAVEKSEWWVTDGRSMTWTEIDRRVGQLKREQGLQFVVVDYDQKVISLSKEEEWKSLQRMVEQAEETAKRETVHVCIFSQSNEEGVPRASIRAMQPAAVVGFFHKEENEFKIKFLKNRFGPTDRDLILNYHADISRITEKGMSNDQGPAPKQESKKLTKPSYHVVQPGG